jgi:hypothetical protein
VPTDAGRLVAIVNRRDPDHRRCVRTVSSFHGPMRTPWPCFTEATSLASRDSGVRGQPALRQLVQAGHVGLRGFQLGV